MCVYVFECKARPRGGVYYAHYQASAYVSVMGSYFIFFKVKNERYKMYNPFIYIIRSVRHRFVKSDSKAYAGIKMENKNGVNRTCVLLPGYEVIKVH